MLEYDINITTLIAIVHQMRPYHHKRTAARLDAAQHLAQPHRTPDHTEGTPAQTPGRSRRAGIQLDFSQAAVCAALADDILGFSIPTTTNLHRTLEEEFDAYLLETQPGMQSITFWQVRNISTI